MTGVTHLASEPGILCWTRTDNPSTTDDIAGVTCLNCRRRWRRLTNHARAVAQERRIASQFRAAADVVGLGPVLDFLETQDDTPSRRIVATVLGSVAMYLRETGYHPPHP